MLNKNKRRDDMVDHIAELVLQSTAEYEESSQLFLENLRKILTKARTEEVTFVISILITELMDRPLFEEFSPTDVLAVIEQLTLAMVAECAVERLVR